jgi:hypothetical protein
MIKEFMKMSNELLNVLKNGGKLSNVGKIQLALSLLQEVIESSIINKIEEKEIKELARINYELWIFKNKMEDKNYAYDELF